MGARILIVDDDPDLLNLLGIRLSAAGHQVIKAASGEEALPLFHQSRPQVVITDLRMGRMDGLGLFARIQADAPLVPVIVLTAHGTIPDAVDATQRGVFSFLTKPFDGQELLRRVDDALRISPSLDGTDPEAHWREAFIASNLKMEDLLRQARRVADERAACLIVGPQGSGKHQLAEAMHRAACPDHPLVVVASTDYPESEQEQLFDATPGSPVTQAEGGILYIQDIGALSLAAQAKLFSLAFAQLQARNPLQRLSGAGPGSPAATVQIIAGSRRPLDAEVAEGSFRSTLYYLLSGNTLAIPPLAERPEDIPLLARHFLKDSDRTLAPEALEALASFRWPGNVRQLQTVLNQAAAISPAKTLSEAAVRRAVRDSEEASLIGLDEARRAFERDYLVNLLNATGGNVSQAARVAQRNRTEFYKLLARHELDPVHFKQTLK